MRQNATSRLAGRRFCFPEVPNSLSLLWILVLVMVLVMVIYPSFVLLVNSVQAGGRLSLANYALVLSRAETWKALRNTLQVSLLGTIFASVIGIGLAWVMARSDVPCKRFFSSALIVPYLIPPFIGAIAWLYLLGPVGYLNKLYMAVSGSSEPVWSIYGAGGVILVMTLYGFPIPYMVNVGAFQRMNAALEQAAQICGAGTLRTLRDITLPLMLPSIAGSTLLLFTSLMANFGIPAVIGFPARFYVLTTRIYATILNFDEHNNLQVASALSMLLVAVAGLAMLAQSAVLRRGSFQVVAGRHEQPCLVELGAARRFVTAGLLVFTVLTTFAPVGAIVVTSLSRAYGLPPAPGNLTLRHYVTAFTALPAAQRAIVNSVLLSVGCATLVVLLSLIVSYYVVRQRVPGGTVLETLLTIPWAVPGTVVALAMILAWLRPVPVLGIRLYNTIWILLLAYVARFFVFGIRNIGASLHQIDQVLEESARISGASPLRTIKDIIWPLVRPGVFAAWFLIVVPALTELTLSALLWSTGNETVGVMVFSLHEEGKIPLSASLSVVIIIVVLIGNWIARLITREEMGF